jgi:glc operon protein GlcG
MNILKQSLLAATVVSAIICGNALAQQVFTPYGTPISLEMAKKVVAGAEAEAIKNNWPMAITIVDSTGHLVLFHRLDNTQYGSIQISEGKAMTALNLRRSTKILEDGIAAGGANLRLLSVPGVMVLEGGLPIEKDGKIIGAIGVSGALATQDAQVGRAGIAALN